jgi:hypothetical protein
VLIAEHLLLLLLDPERGTLVVHRDATDADHLAAAAVLLDLAEQRVIVHRKGHIVSQPRFGAGHPLLASAAETIAAAGPGLPLASALDLIETRARPVACGLLDGLHRRDLLHRERRPPWWPWAEWRYPLRSLQARNEALALLRDDARSPLRVRGLLLLIDCAGRLPDFLDAVAHARATESLLALGRREQDARNDATGPEALLAALRSTLLDE